jgi:UDP-glucuronate decarboxylase
LVTGAGGFIGRWSVRPLLERNYEVHGVLSGQSGRRTPAELQGAQVHFADLLNETDLDALLKHVRPTHLLHFAWVATPGLYWQSPDNDRWLSASKQLLRCFSANGGVRAVMAGSCAEYDWSKASVCDEWSTPMADQAATPLSPYSACKISLQRVLAEFGSREQLSTAWGRVFFQFGPNEHPNRLVPSVIRNLLVEREAMCSHGRQIRSFLYAADVGAAFAGLLDSSVEGPVNIGSDERISVAELINHIAQQIGRPELVRLGARPAPAEEPLLLVPAVHRLREEVLWRPQFTLDRAISDTIAWWREHP